MTADDVERRLRRTAQACLRGLVLAVLSPLGIPLFTLSVVAIVYLPLGVGILLTPVALLGVRRLAGQQRRWAREWSGVPVAVGYRPAPETGGRLRTCGWLLRDPATWRDLLWSIVNVPVGILFGVLPTSLIVHGLAGILVAPWFLVFSGGHRLYWALSIPAGVVLLLLGLTAGPAILAAHARFTQLMLAPSRRAMMARVGQLTESRSQAVDASAAELRRIERDLHDGAQARLVALGMNIGLAEQLVKDNPEMALTLLAEARQASGQALAELRDLVRGIHPPVLAERGLDGAVRALALTLPIPVDLHIELPGRPPAPVESAAYFAVAEALANVVKHSLASRVWVTLRHDAGRLTAIVRDNGVGGADPHAGTGLRGVSQRLAAFDGMIAVTSPTAGPTVVTMELPCELSSARITPSYGTA